MVVKEISDEKCRIFVHDDCMVKPDERAGIMQRVSEIVMEYYRNKEKTA